MDDDVILLKEIESIEVEDDDIFLTPVSCGGSTKRDAIPVELYSEERDLHQAIMASILEIDLSQPYHDEEVQEINPVNWSGKKPLNSPSISETGQSSNSKPPSTFVCEICIEPKSQSESFRIKGCSHSYCSDCMTKYVAAKIQENVTRINCPVSSCGGVLEPEYCRGILPPEVFDRWGNALCESLILGSERFYCPFKDCSALLIHDGEEAIKESECPNCWRLFCAQCKVPWHSGIDCKSFQKLNANEKGREDLMLMELAKNKNWQRCPKCRFYVEKSEGCMYMKCRCGFAFCYNCGSPSTSDQYHYCTNCKR